MDHGDHQAAGSRPSDLPQRMPVQYCHFIEAIAKPMAQLARIPIFGPGFMVILQTVSSRLI